MEDSNPVEERMLFTIPAIYSLFFQYGKENPEVTEKGDEAYEKGGESFKKAC